jgi:aspartate aminotransferase-like enzyme
VLHDLDGLKSFARTRRLALCLDCISSIGAVDVDLSGVHLASGVSGKGLAALPGLALVFHATIPMPRTDLPRYLDLGLWAACGSVPFTHSSNLVTALDVALAEVERLPAGRCGSSSDANWLRAELRNAGFEVLAIEPHASPIIVTVALPAEVDAHEIGAELERRGFLASHRSGYLEQRNWIQFCLMASPSRAVLSALVAELCTVAVANGYVPVTGSPIAAVPAMA